MASCAANHQLLKLATRFGEAFSFRQIPRGSGGKTSKPVFRRSMTRDVDKKSTSILFLLSLSPPLLLSSTKIEAPHDRCAFQDRYFCYPTLTIHPPLNLPSSPPILFAGVLKSVVWVRETTLSLSPPPSIFLRLGAIFFFPPEIPIPYRTSLGDFNIRGGLTFVRTSCDRILSPATWRESFPHSTPQRSCLSSF